MNAYFDRLHYLMPAIDKPTFLNQYNHLMDNLGNVSVARSKAPFSALVFAVFACAARIVDDPRLSARGRGDDGGAGMMYYERSVLPKRRVISFHNRLIFCLPGR